MDQPLDFLIFFAVACMQFPNRTLLSQMREKRTMMGEMLCHVCMQIKRGLRGAIAEEHVVPDMETDHDPQGEIMPPEPWVGAMFQNLLDETIIEQSQFFDPPMC